LIREFGGAAVAWRHYDEVRPHRVSGYLTPAKYKRKHLADAMDVAADLGRTMRAGQLMRGEGPMQALMITVGTLIFAAGFACGGRLQPPVGAQTVTVVMDCGASAPQVRTTLYFGLARPKGTVTELEWQIFLRDEVTRRFPDGLTVWEAEGQWRTPAGSIDHEQSKVLLLVHPDTAAAQQSVLAVIEAYRKTFEQQSVLWESARVCGAA
jgi:Protein of unknown function (DUF3574)